MSRKLSFAPESDFSSFSDQIYTMIVSEQCEPVELELSGKLYSIRLHKWKVNKSNFAKSKAVAADILNL